MTNVMVGFAKITKTIQIVFAGGCLAFRHCILYHLSRARFSLNQLMYFRNDYNNNNNKQIKVFSPICFRVSFQVGIIKLDQLFYIHD